MNKSKLLKIVGTFLVVMVIIIAPTPVHSWLSDHSAAGIPLEQLVIALIILFTPVTILTSIMRKFDVDFVDETPADGSHADPPNNLAMHGHH